MPLKNFLPLVGMGSQTHVHIPVKRTPDGADLQRISIIESDAFGISPREAASIDPQQMLLLEVVWGALRDASIPLATLPMPFLVLDRKSA
jgi:acyl transferase domain-containing protein